MNKRKIGLGLITCNRPDFFKTSLDSIPRNKIQELVIVNDGAPVSLPTIDGEYIQNKTNLGVGKSKNKAFQYLLDKQCTDIFLMEDDIIIKNSEVFEAYIHASVVTNIKHLMFGYHGPANKHNGTPAPRVVVEYTSEFSLALNHHCVGAFCYYTSDILNDIGLNDEHFVNAWEHVEHSYRIVKKGYLPGYWWWPDLVNSCEYLDELACSEVSSTIRPREDWRKNIQEGAEYFILKHGFSPVNIPNLPYSEISQNLKQIFKNKK